MLLDKKMKGRGWKGEYVDYSALKLSEKKDRLREGERGKNGRERKNSLILLKLKRLEVLLFWEHLKIFIHLLSLDLSGKKLTYPKRNQNFKMEAFVKF